MRATVKNVPIAGGRHGSFILSLRLFEMIILHPAPQLEEPLDPQGQTHGRDDNVGANEKE
jgi:hypothetical protein